MKDNCPSCGASFQGGMIPEDQRHLFGGKAHFSRMIGIVINDRVVCWRCPDCGHMWPRCADIETQPDTNS